MKKVVKKVISLLLACSLVFVMPCNTLYASEQVADFEIDSELWKCIVETNMFDYDADDDGIVTKDEFADSYGMQIDAAGYDIKDWSGLKNATGWQMIYIRNFPGGDLSALSELENLRKIGLDVVSDYNDIIGLEKIPNLIELSISCDNEIDLSKYANLSKLGIISFKAPSFSKYEALSEYEGLYSLGLSGTSINGIENLPELPEVSTLYINYPDLDDSTLSGIIAKMDKLTEIRIENSNITNMDWLKEVNDIENSINYIDVSENKITDINTLLDVIDTMNNLSELYIGGNPLDNESRIKLIESILNIEDNSEVYVGSMTDIFDERIPFIDVANDEYLNVESTGNEIAEIVDEQIVAKNVGSTTLKFTYEDIAFEYTLTVKANEEKPPVPTETPDPTATPTPEPTEPITPDIKLGDVDYDNVICAEDALLVLKHAAKLETLSDDAIILADVTQDETVNAEDALEILKYAAILIRDFN